MTTHKSSILRLTLIALAIILVLAPDCSAQATKLHSQLITPLTFSLTSTDPDTGTVTGSGSASVTFRTTSGLPSRSWSVRVKADSTVFTGCPSPVPTSVVKLTCTSATVDSPGTGTCATPVTVSTSFQPLAGGVEDGKSNAYYDVTFNVNVVFTDAWNYIPTTTPCTANLTYEIVAN
jgi:hypothetical protein